MAVALQPPGIQAGMGGSPASTGLTTPLIKLTKMEPEDNPEVFLVVFERVAMAAKWATGHWAVILVP